ncbi:hypothetical protein CTI12_AA069100 [Artemisia annua]|uniref:Bet v I/Major latex protein domain-containing protein n=1 Tax=Artemisia annua TaxID=35608 RepID=A0A2U1Q6J6_ARTAN|nr:hypothetical protein CTI12_AA069100 [Artemisia annua]
MYGTSEDIELKVPASKAWSIYGTLELGKLLIGKVAGKVVFEAVEVVEGDGGTGTIIKISISPLRPFEIKDNPNGQSCLLKFKVEYDIKEEFAANAFSYHHGAIHCFNKCCKGASLEVQLKTRNICLLVL